jgi:formate dehydrogenase major subunit
MDLTRRQFVTRSAGFAALALGFDLTPCWAQANALKITRTTETRSNCPYCSVCCGVIIHTIGDRAKNVLPQIIHIEGDSNHPVNRGTLCPKGGALLQDCVNERRLTKPQVRRPGGTEWEDISWELAFAEIARKVKDTRDAGFEEQDDRGRLVNRCDSIAFFGGATDTNEFSWVAVKTMAAMGVIRRENVART